MKWDLGQKIMSITINITNGFNLVNLFIFVHFTRAFTINLSKLPQSSIYVNFVCHQCLKFTNFEVMWSVIEKWDISLYSYSYSRYFAHGNIHQEMRFIE